MPKWSKIRKRFICLDCKIDTLESKEYYMVKDKVWEIANPKIDGMLCLDCLEKRLGRSLLPEDFIECLANKESAEVCEKLARKLLGKYIVIRN